MKNKTKRLSALDKQYLWHPFTPMRDWLANEPLIIERGKGAYLYDTNGRRYLDGVSSLWVTVHGHSHPVINRALIKQLKKVSHSTLLGLSNEPAILLAAKLAKLTPPGLTKVFFSDNGSTAVEIALKIAFQYWQQTTEEPVVRQLRRKTKFITLTNAYHGDTIGSVSVGGIDLFHQLYRPLLFQSFKTPAGNIAALEKLLKKHHQETAAIIVEPLIQGAAGILTMPKGFLKKARQLCDRYHVLLICDEVATGFGRTGKMFACEWEKVAPDILCVAKGLTGGYLPVAATLTTGKIFRAFLGQPEEGKTFFHGHTFTGNPLGCAAALASLSLFKKEHTLQNVRKNIIFLNRKLKRFQTLPHVGAIRQCGLMAGIELFLDKKNMTAYPPAKRMGHQVAMEARKRGVIIRPLGDVVVLMPPLCITTKQLRRLLAVVYNSIRKVTS